ncbi:GNAT family N-acetyltransferase [Blastococcus haudaquaticus]|uniref:Ribosomal protein S18 acetylase RimI n=1 Tax=Blastococcus haudaquaticus TaxID=1938745 RepID=A0A286H3D1_9ACTN|nr:GNAT family N-acetyltransferase [Blastococcus haudaquaticus]SOE02267.1 Ribosomal protein S18 acetylase RimI [Blastococcus haudaquaticus]
MRLRAIGRDPVVITVAAALFALSVLAVNILWPAAFGVFIAVGGVVGALVVVYEVRLTKRLAQAEFIRDLQTGFASDANIGALWRKLLLKEEVVAADRPLVSSYLTFFETLHLLVRKGALDLALTDDLFRNRFFTAVGNKGVLETALVKEAGSFANIHALIESWHGHLLHHKIPMHPGYYGYVQALTEAKGYEITRLGPADLPDLEHLQSEVLSTIKDDSWLRANTDVMLKECLIDHITLGARQHGTLVAAAILYDGGGTDESIKHYFTDEAEALQDSINLKLVLALPEHRKKGLARALVELLEQQATDLGKKEIMCTVHPDNTASQSLFRLLGYHKVDSVSTSYGKRVVLRRKLPVLNKRWAR